MSLSPAVDCIGYCAACVVNISFFAALGTDRARERSLLAKVTILTHLSGFAASCVTAAGHKTCNRSWMQRSCLNAGDSGTLMNSCLVTSATLVPTCFLIHDWRHQIIFFSVAHKIDKHFPLSKIPFLLAAASPLCFPDMCCKKKERSEFIFQLFSDLPS